MARRKLERTVLFSATEALLVEQGYKGFNFKALSERLNIGRSTLYEYYASKEELLTDYMEYIMEAIIDDCHEITGTASAVDTLKRVLKIFLKYSQFHQIAIIIPFIDPYHSPQVEVTLANLKRDHNYLYNRVCELIDQGKKEKNIRNDIATAAIAGMIFNAIQVQNVVKISEEQWSEMVLEILFNGIGN